MERRLKDYKGFTVIKETGGNDTYYWLLDSDDNTINVFTTLDALKKDVNNIWSK